MNFISELKDTSPEVSRRVYEKGNNDLMYTHKIKNEDSYVSKSDGKNIK